VEVSQRWRFRSKVRRYPHPRWCAPDIRPRGSRAAEKSNGGTCYPTRPPERVPCARRNGFTRGVAPIACRVGAVRNEPYHAHAQCPRPMPTPRGDPFFHAERHRGRSATGSKSPTRRPCHHNDPPTWIDRNESLCETVGRGEHLAAAAHAAAVYRPAASWRLDRNRSAACRRSVDSRDPPWRQFVSTRLVRDSSPVTTRCS
jgi:hypothetical protein